jgi:hypothetical protein
MITPYKPVPERFPDEEVCRVCGGVRSCLKGKAVDRPLLPRKECPDSDPRLWRW